MMGFAHATSGVALGLVAVGAATTHGLTPAPTLAAAVMVAAVWGGAAIAPDMDHPDASMARTWGLLTRIAAWMVRKVAGGHRNGTHSALGCAVAALAVFGATGLHLGDVNVVMAGLVAAGLIAVTGLPVPLLAGSGDGAIYKTKVGAMCALTAIAGTALGLTVAAMLYGRIVGTIMLGLILMLALSALARVAHVPGQADDLAPFPIVYLLLAPEWAMPQWMARIAAVMPEVDPRLLAVAVVGGVLTHCAGDAITKGGIPWGWPLSRVNVGPKVIETNGVTERRVILPALMVVIAWMVIVLAGVVAGAVVVAGLVWMLVEYDKRNRRSQSKRKSGTARKKAALRKTTARKAAPRKRKTPARTR
jgi:membrane-bound metal-dependent hydrolase YbcI (DUF457 family)